MSADEMELVGWVHDWDSGHAISHSFMAHAPQQDAEQWYPVYARPDDRARAQVATEADE